MNQENRKLHSLYISTVEIPKHTQYNFLPSTILVKLKAMKILLVGYNVPHSGFTRVMHSIIANLDPNHEIHYISLGLVQGQRTYQWGENVHLHTYDPQEQFDPLRNESIKEFLIKDQPDIVFMLNDIWFFKYYAEILKQHLGKAKLVYYTPIDGRLVDCTALVDFEIVDELVAYTAFGAQELQRGIDTLIATGKMNHRPNLSTIAHGVDTARFRPLGGEPGTTAWKAGKLSAKQQLWGKEVATDDAFIVLNANRMQSRKCIDVTIEGFAKFAKDKPANVKLCLHHAILPPDAEKQLNAWVKQWGIEDRLLFRKVDQQEEHIDDEALNLIYNACDVGVNTSQGEGWGLIAFEHAATGAAQIVPQHSACTELWENAGLLLAPKTQHQPARHPMSFTKVSADELALHLEYLYRNKKALNEWSKRAYQHAHSPHFQWNSIGSAWDQLFQHTITQGRNVTSLLNQ